LWLLDNVTKVRKYSGTKKILQGQGKVREFYDKSGKAETIAWLIYSIEGWKKHFRAL